MKKVKLGIIFAVMSVSLLSCSNSNNVAAEEGGIQIDPELKELGELNALLLQYDDVGDKLGDLIAVKSKKKWGLINLKGDTILEFKYGNIYKCIEYDIWGISKELRYQHIGFADAQGKIMLNPEGGKSYEILSNDYFVEKNRGFCTLYNKDGDEVFIIDEEDEMEVPAYDIKYNGNGLFMIYNGDKWYMARHKDSESSITVIGENGYSDCGFTNDLCFVKNDDGKWGVINGAGEIVVPFNYFDKKGINLVQNEEGKWGMFNGKEVNSYYDNLIYEIDGYTDGKDGEDYIVLDKQGKELLRKKDMKLFPFCSNGAFLGNHSVYDSKGNTIVTLNDSLTPIYYLNNYIVVNTTNRLCGIVDKKGTFVYPASDAFSSCSKDSPLIVMTRNISDEFVDDERIIVNVSDIFNTNNGTITKTFFDLSSSHFVDGLSLATVEGRHIYVNEEGKTGLLNIEEVLKSFAEKKEQMKKQEQEEGMERIKEQLVDDINKMNGRKILSGSNSLRDMEKLEGGTYKCHFTDYGKYENITYEIYNIQVDKEYNLIDFGIKATDIRPTADKPDGTMNVQEMIDRMTGRIR